ncbi:MAG: SIMPL domain-containing protein [Sphaerochaeta sp.]|nr:SIMPL domain-containing protein [Sphaerochaeta sp.]
MRRIRTAIVALLAIGALVLAGCATTEAVQGTITVTGSGTVEVKPDMASFRVTAKETRDTTKEAQNATNEKVAQVLALLRAQGVAEDDITTQSLNLYTEYTWENNKQQKVGESCSQTLSVKLRDLSQLGSVLDQLGGIDSLSLDSIQFDKADKSAELAEARRKAALDAKQKAGVYAETYQMILGAPLSITEGTTATQPVYRNAKLALAVASEAMTATEAPSGVLSLNAVVTVVFGAGN